MEAACGIRSDQKAVEAGTRTDEQRPGAVSGQPDHPQAPWRGDDGITPPTAFHLPSHTCAHTDSVHRLQINPDVSMPSVHVFAVSSAHQHLPPQTTDFECRTSDDLGCPLEPTER